MSKRGGNANCRPDLFAARPRTSDILCIFLQHRIGDLHWHLPNHQSNQVGRQPDRKKKAARRRPVQSGRKMETPDSGVYMETITLDSGLFVADQRSYLDDAQRTAAC